MWGIGNDTQLKLLGVQWGQFPEQWEIGKSSKHETAEAPLVTEGAYVTGFSGMSCVIPATDILRLLNLPELKDKIPSAPMDIPMPELKWGVPVLSPAATKEDG
jgi:hypothetical protein